MDNFVRIGNSEAKKGGNNTWLARTDDVNVYIEHCKKLKPSVYSSEFLGIAFPCTVNGLFL